MLQGGQFDTIYHEHINYFTINSLMHCLRGTDLKIAIFDEFPDLHGGTLRVYLDKRPRHDTIAYFRSKAEMEIMTPKFFGDFATKIEGIKSEFMQLVEGIKWGQDSLVCYGASAKSTVMLNYFGLQPDYVVDDTPTKQWMYTPGSNCEIRPSSTLREDENPLTIILTAWNFAGEIIKKITDLRKNCPETKIITYLPRVGTLKTASV